MLRHVLSRLGIGLLLSTLVFGSLLPDKGAMASDGTADPGEKAKHHPSAKNTPTVRGPHRQRRGTLEVLFRVKGEGQNIFTKDGKITLMLDKGHAGYRMAAEAAEMINSRFSFKSGGTPPAKALDRANVEVTVPAQYRDVLVAFISQILSLPMLGPGLEEAVAITVGPLRPGKSAAASGGSTQRARKDTPIVPKPRRGDKVTLKDVCRVRGEGENIFTKDGKITLALHEDYAGYRVAQEAAEMINSQLSFQSGGTTMARALDQVNIEVAVPAQYRDDPVVFISQVLSLPMSAPEVDEPLATRRSQ